jgi:hypothetical protein
MARKSSTERLAVPTEDHPRGRERWLLVKTADKGGS